MAGFHSLRCRHARGIWRSIIPTEFDSVNASLLRGERCVELRKFACAYPNIFP